MAQYKLLATYNDSIVASWAACYKCRTSQIAQSAQAQALKGVTCTGGSVPKKSVAPVQVLNIQFFKP